MTGTESQECDDVAPDHQRLSITDGPSLQLLKEEEQNGHGGVSLPLPEQETKRILEAILFVSHDPISLDKFALLLEGVSKPDILQALQKLQSDYDQQRRGIQLSEVAGGFLFTTRPDCGPYIRRLTKSRSSAKLSRSALETLAIIGYKQPITRVDIEKIRGVETSGVLRTLLDQKLVRIVGRQDVPGRPILYGTSKQFLLRFGLRDLRDLPPLKEIQDLGAPGTLHLPFEGDSCTGDTSPGERVDFPA